MYETKRQNRSLHSRHTRRQGAMMDAGSVASEQSLESALAPTYVAAAAAAAATAAAAPTSFSLYSLPDVAIGHVSSFLQFKVVARLLKVSKSTQEAVYAGETVLVFPKEATDAAVIAMVRKFHNLKLVNLGPVKIRTPKGQIRAITVGYTY